MGKPDSYIKHGSPFFLTISILDNKECVSTSKKNKEEFAKLLRSTERNGVEDMLTDLEKSGFFTAPASSCHHLNIAGGLTLHSLNTCKSARYSACL